MRLNKYIGNSGFTSRRKADALIAAGRVLVDGTVVTEMGYKVTGDAVVEVDGMRVEVPQEKLIVMLNKPVGVTTTMEDRHAEKLVGDLLPSSMPRLNPVGRLDKRSEGLILLTNDGELAHELTHPSFEHEKEYEAKTALSISDEQLQQMRDGVELEEGITSPAKVVRHGDKAFTITLKQGWKRQVRRMAAGVGSHIVSLRRVRVGKLQLGRLESGEHRVIQKSDVV
jgi:pseudouridine synthase